MAIPYSALLLEAEALSERLARRRLSRLAEVARGVFSFSVEKGEKLVLSLFGVSPAVYLSSTLPDVESLPSSFYLYLRKECQGARVKKVSTVNGDRVLRFELEAIGPTFKPIALSLIAELVPSKPNLILLDEEDKVLIAYRMGSFGAGRMLLRGMLYEPPEKRKEAPAMPAKGERFSLTEYCAEQEKGEAAILERRKREKYKPLFDLAKRKVKSGKKKVAILEEDKKEAESHLNDGDYGNFIYTNLESIDPRSGSMTLDDGRKIPLNPLKSATENAEAFFRRAKKSKVAVALSEQNRQKAERELAEYEELQQSIQTADEELMDELMARYGEKGQTRGKKKKGEDLISSASLPYSCSLSAGTVVSFGKSAKQNDFLTFHLDTSPNHVWLHVLEGSGSHVMIRKSNPTDAEVQLAAELCLLASDYEDGEVMVTERVNVRRGNVPGLAVVSTYRSYRITHITPEAKALFQGAKKVALKQ